MQRFNPFLAVARIHKDMNDKMALFTSAIASSDKEDIDCLVAEQRQYIDAVTQLLEAIDRFIEAEDSFEMKMLEEHAINMLSVSVEDIR